MDNKVMCGRCKQKKDRAIEMFPIQIIIPVFKEDGGRSIQFVFVCLDCFDLLANSIDKYICKEDLI